MPKGILVNGIFSTGSQKALLATNTSGVSKRLSSRGINTFANQVITNTVEINYHMRDIFHDNLFSRIGCKLTINSRLKVLLHFNS